MRTITEIKNIGMCHGACDVDQCLLIDMHEWSCGCNEENSACYSATVALTNHLDPDTLLRLAESAAVTQRTLATLAQSPYVEVRQAVADNARTPYDTLMQLVSDENADVRYHLAANYEIPERLLQILAGDENPYVSDRAFRTLERKHRTDVALWSLTPAQMRRAV